MELERAGKGQPGDQEEPPDLTADTLRASPIPLQLRVLLRPSQYRPHTETLPCRTASPKEVRPRPHPQLVTVTLFGNRVFTGVIELR